MQNQKQKSHSLAENTKFSEKTTTLRSLLKQDSLFIWDKQYLKQEISKAFELMYDNAVEEATFEVDGSMKGLGAALMEMAALLPLLAKH